MVLGGEEGFECDICVDVANLGQMSEFKHLGCVLDESDSDVADCHGRL